MTNDEKTELLLILNPSNVKAKIGARLKAIEYIKNLPENATEGENSVNTGTRTGSQNAGMHLWFKQVSDACIENGVEASAVFAKTHNIQMTPEAVKAMWKALQTALFGKTSTTQLKKTGEIDKLQDHFIRFFAENFELELPPFPSDDHKIMDRNFTKDTVEYPTYEGKPTI